MPLPHRPSVLGQNMHGGDGAARRVDAALASTSVSRLRDHAEVPPFAPAFFPPRIPELLSGDYSECCTSVLDARTNRAVWQSG